MKDDPTKTETAQHEVRTSLPWFELGRRDFLKVMGGGIAVCVGATWLPAQETGSVRRGHPIPQDIAAWLHVAEDGRVTVYTGKVEMGQNIRTSLAQQVAEELRMPVAEITMVMGDTSLVPWDAGTFGSRTTPTMGPQLRAAAATARDLLIQTAAARWRVGPETLVASEGRITNPHTGQALSYGELTHGQKIVHPIASDPKLTPAADWKVAGTPVPKVNGRDFVTGKHQYASDLSRPGMLHGKVVRPSGFSAKLVSADTRAAEKTPGVTVVRDGDFIGVAAPDVSTAQRAAEAVRATWQVPPQPSNRELFEYLKQNVDPAEEGERQATGSVEPARAGADVKLEANYTVEYIAHAPLEPRAALAEWESDTLNVWTGTQRPFAVRDQLAAAFRIPPEKVRVRVPDTGSAYGGKHTGECAIEAARLAKAAGKPVRLVWTREEEFTWAYFRPAGVIEVRSGVRRDGTLVAWEFHNYNSGPAAMGTPYTVPNVHIEYHPVKSPLRQGSYRGLAATANHFARESHMDELAHALGMDPLQFRMKNLTDQRLRDVFQAAAERFGWGRERSTPTRAFGIAGGIEKGGRMATCVEIAVDHAGGVRLRRVVEAWDSGAVVNPNGLNNQITGAIVQGIGGALFEAVRFANGRIENPHFAEYRVPRFRDVPDIDVVILDRKDQPSAGAGETPLFGLAPAVANAIFAATGKRLRGLPLLPGQTS